MLTKTLILHGFEAFVPFLWVALLPERDWTKKIYSTVALLFLFYPFPGLNSTDELLTFIRHNMYRTQTPTYTTEGQ